jgi:hypothetical protein
VLCFHTPAAVAVRAADRALRLAHDMARQHWLAEGVHAHTLSSIFPAVHKRNANDRMYIQSFECRADSCTRRSCLPLCLAVCGAAGIHKWGSRKESGAIMQPIPTEDPDQLPPKPRLRPNTMQRPAAVAAAAAASSGGSPLGAGASSAGLMQLPVPGGARPPSLLQMATINSSSNARDSVTGRKKMVSRPGSAVNLAAVQRSVPVADADSP